MLPVPPPLPKVWWCIECPPISAELSAANGGDGAGSNDDDAPPPPLAEERAGEADKYMGPLRPAPPKALLIGPFDGVYDERLIPPMDGPDRLLCRVPVTPPPPIPLL